MAGDGTPGWDDVWARNTESLEDLCDGIRTRAASRSEHPADVARILEDLGRSCAGLRVIELGCGYGRESAALALRGAEVSLLDPSKRALAKAVEVARLLGFAPKTYEATLEGALEATGGGFDLALSVGLVEHFPREERSAAWRAHLDLLRPGGLAVLTMPNAGCPFYRLWKAIAERRGLWSVGFELPYTRGEVDALLRDLGVTGGRRGFGFWYATNRFFLEKAYWALHNLLRYRSLRAPTGVSFRRPAWLPLYEGPSLLDDRFGYAHVVWFERPAQGEGTSRSESPSPGGARRGLAPEA